MIDRKRDAYDRARFNALTDGVFAVAMTLLVLDLRVPDDLRISDGGSFLAALHLLAPKAGAYLLSFLVAGLVWLSRAAIDEAPPVMSRREALLGLGYLLLVTLVPFSTIVIGQHPTITAAVWIYCGNVGLLGLFAAAMRTQIPEPLRDERYRERIAGSLLVTASAVIAAILATTDLKNEALWAFALNFGGPFIRRIARASRAAPN